jgi:hypothetical protein
MRNGLDRAEFLTEKSGKHQGLSGHRHLAPSPPIFLRMQRGITWQRSCKKSGERVGARGPFLHAVSQKIPAHPA